MKKYQQEKNAAIFHYFKRIKLKRFNSKEQKENLYSYTKKSQRIKKKSNITALKHLPSYKKLLKKRPTSHLDSGGDNIHYKLLQSPIIKDRGSFQIKTKESTTDQPLCVCSHP